MGPSGRRVLDPCCVSISSSGNRDSDSGYLRVVVRVQTLSGAPGSPRLLTAATSPEPGMHSPSPRAFSELLSRGSARFGRLLSVPAGLILPCRRRAWGRSAGQSPGSLVVFRGSVLVQQTPGAVCQRSLERSVTCPACHL